MPVVVSVPGMDDISVYRYSGDGQRYAKSNSERAIEEHYLLDGSQTLAVLDRSANTITWNLVLPSGEAFGRMVSNQRRYYHKDHLGSVRVVTTSTGNVVQTRDYYPFPSVT